MSDSLNYIEFAYCIFFKLHLIYISILLYSILKSVRFTFDSLKNNWVKLMNIYMFEYGKAGILLLSYRSFLNK